MPRIVKMEVTPSLGMNTALNPSTIPQGAQRQAYDACMREVGTIGKRPGSAPVIETALSNDISYLTTYTYPLDTITATEEPDFILLSVGFSSLPVGTYYVRYTYVTEVGESAASPEASATTTSSNRVLHIEIPAFPKGVKSANIYMGTAPNSGKLEANTTVNYYNKRTALTGTVPYPTVSTVKKSTSLLAVSGQGLYEYYNGALNAITMEDDFATDQVFSVAFTNSALTSVMLCTDGGNLKQYNSVQVEDVTPATNDPDPAPANDLTAINTKGPEYIWSHTNHVFLSDGTDIVWYSKRFEFDYFPSTQFFRFVRNNDFISGPGITFAGVCLIPMRRGWGVISGEVFDDGAVSNGFKANQYLNTTNGNISSRGIARISYPDGTQTIAYVSDDGVHEIFDTGFEGEGVRLYSTRSLMKDKINFDAFGFSSPEKESAVAHYDSVRNWLHIAINSVSGNYIFIYDTRNGEWYVWRMPWSVKALAKWGDTNYFGGVQKLLQSFSDDLYTDWNESSMTTGETVDFDVYSGLISFEFSGDASYLDYYLCEAAMWNVPSSLDVWIVYGAGKQEFAPAQDNEIFIWGITAWGQGQYANLDYTDNVNNAKRLVLHKKAKYFQRRWRNNKDQPVSILREKFTGRITGRA